MKKILVLLLAMIFVSACARTSDPDNPAGKVDMSKPVDYVVVSEEERDDAIYILTGRSPEESEETEPGEDTEASEETEEAIDQGIEETEPIEETESPDGEGN